MSKNTERRILCRKLIRAWPIRVLDCKYYVVFIPKRRRKVLYGQIRRHLGAILHELARQTECRIIEGHIIPAHVHMLIAIPPKYSVASASGFLKGKSAIAIARKLSGRDRNVHGRTFLSCGYAVLAVGFNVDQIRDYIWDQDDPADEGRF